jgi:hypothetical protein
MLKQMRERKHKTYPNQLYARKLLDLVGCVPRMSEELHLKRWLRISKNIKPRFKRGNLDCISSHKGSSFRLVIEVF